MSAFRTIEEAEITLGRMAMKLDRMERDLEEAAGELLVGIAEAAPGTTVAKLLHANVMLRKYDTDEVKELKAVICDLVDACDRLMGDSDLPDDDNSPEMKAMKRAVAILKTRGEQ